MNELVTNMKDTLRQRRRELMAELLEIDSMLGGKSQKRRTNMSFAEWEQIARTLGPIFSPAMLRRSSGRGGKSVTVWCREAIRRGILIRELRGMYRFAPEAK